MWKCFTGVILIFTFVAVDVCSGQNSTNTGEQTGKANVVGVQEKTSLEKGMEPVFKMCHGFLKTVMTVDFYESQSSAFGKYICLC